MTGFRKENEVYVQFNTIVAHCCYIQIKTYFLKENQDYTRNSIPFLNLKQCVSAFTGAEDSGNLAETGKIKKQIEELQLQMASYLEDYVISNLS